MIARAGYREVEPSWLTKPVIHGFAEDVSSSLNYKPEADLSALVESLGGRVRIENTLLEDPEQSGSLFVDGPADFTIIVPSHTSLLRDRFTVAHELGHYYVHYVYPKHIGSLSADRIMALRKGSNRIEWEANWFAAAFLMPSASFKASFMRNGSDVALTAREYNVSRRAVEVRAQDLRLL